MKNLQKFFSLAVVAVALSACAGNACTNYGDYEQIPYGDERTAGQGTAVYGDECYTESTTTMKKADPVIRQKARK